MNILVTGANGQLGCEMRRLGAVSPNNYIFTDVAELDITDSDAVMRVVKECTVEAIVNCAAYTNVKDCETEEGFKKAMFVNCESVKNLANLCNEFGIFTLHSVFKSFIKYLNLFLFH